MNEFDFIAAHLAPLAGPGGLNLADDAAVLKPNPGKDLILTKDTMVEGVHFPKGHYGSDTAGKLLRVNLSDLAAKGAHPIGYMLSIVWPRGVDPAHYGDFAKGLRDVQEGYDFHLLGGDTTATDGAMVVTATLIGEVPTGGMVRRSGAKPGDDIWVTGTIGDAYLGLQTVLGETLEPEPEAEAIRHFEEAYFRPEPRLLFRKALRQYATACADISDGLVADAGHIAKASHVAMSIEADKIPLSKHTGAWLSAQLAEEAAFKLLMTAGDDYELIFTAPPEKQADIRKSAAQIGLRVSKIGAVQDGQGVTLFSNGKALTFESQGYSHF